MKTPRLVLFAGFAALAALPAVPQSASAQQPASPPTSSAVVDTAKAPPVKLETFLGFYEAMPGRGITVTVDKDVLVATATNGEGVRFIRKSSTTFDVEGKEITVSFTMGKDGKPTELVLRQGDAQRVLKYIPNDGSEK